MKIDKYVRQSIVKAIMADVPKPDKAKRRADLQAAIVKAMSPNVRKVFKESPGALKTHYFGDMLYDGHNWDSRGLVVGDVTEEKLEELAKPHKDEDDAIHAARNKLECAIEGCTTRKALMTRLPEFEKYYPAEEAPMSKSLPALANVMADLSKLGWPKKPGTV
jgi:Nucleotide modification associated domain 5